MAALMSSSLGAYRGANTRCCGVPETSTTLDHKRIVSLSANSKFGSSVRPARSSRRKIPRQFVAVNKELMGTIGSVTCDKENSIPVVGKARIGDVARKPAPHIPIRFKPLDNDLKSGTTVG